MYQIEVAKTDTETKTDKGNILEVFSEKFLSTLNYKVSRQVRITAAELDLLCENTINGKIIYVECKAQVDPLSSNILTNLLGTITLKNHSEGWLITTGPLGKDAKGFISEWDAKPKDEREKLSIFTPDKLIKSFISSKMIVDPKLIKCSEIDKLGERIGNWTLIISSFGEFWALECLEGGIPIGLLVFSAQTGAIISEIALLTNLSKTNTSLKDLDFLYINKIAMSYSGSQTTFDNTVVPVQHGESWDDYRPARPEDFVGRMDSQNKLLQFFNSVRENKTTTRIFAVVGNSGMGKSSFIAKMRDRVRNMHYIKKYYIYAVDVRAAKHHTYILNSLLNCFVEAKRDGFLTTDNFSITDYTNPFNSDTIKKALDELKKKNRVLILVFDQFEELYSRPELYSIFEKVKDISLNAVSIQENFAIGFAWKTDSTVYQDHPAYHLWHNLHDQRFEILLAPFSKGDSENILSIFEKQLSGKLPKDLKHQLISHAQGYPWLLKKLCIHIFEQLREEYSIDNLITNNLDIEYLFNKDLQELSPPEISCLNIVAQKAPVDLSEITEITSSEALTNLINRRLIIRSGDRLIIYWDIFREFLLTKKVPSLPFNYLPVSPSLKTFLNSIIELKKDAGTSSKELAMKIKVSERTAMNIVSDLFMLKIAEGKSDNILLKKEVSNSSALFILSYLKIVFTRHIVVQELRTIQSGSLITQDDLITILRNHNPTAQHTISTWRLYANRIGKWLSSFGYLIPSENAWINTERDIKDIDLEYSRSSSVKGAGYGFTIFNTSPEKVLLLLNELTVSNKKYDFIKKEGLKNAESILIRLGLIETNNKIVSLKEEYKNCQNFEMLIIQKYYDEYSYKDSKEYYKNNRNNNKPAVFGEYLKNKYNMKWSYSTVVRVGNSLTLWYKWIGSNINEPGELL